MIDRESDGRFIASIPDLGDLAAYGEGDKDAVAQGPMPQPLPDGTCIPELVELPYPGAA
jgi:hypothetical protein